MGITFGDYLIDSGYYDPEEEHMPIETEMRTYTITQEQMDRLHGAAHSGAMLGGKAAYDSCLKVEAILAEIAFKEGFDKSPGSAPEPPYPFCRTPEKCAGKGYCQTEFACND